MSRIKIWTMSLSLMVFLLLAATVSAQNNQMIPFNGTAPGQPDGAVDLTFKLYDAAVAGTLLGYSDAQTGVALVSEGYSTVLGSGNGGPIPVSIFANIPTVFIAAEFTSTPGTEIGPRVPLYASGYALSAQSAQIATSARTANTLNAGAVVSGSLPGPVLRATNSSGIGLYGETQSGGYLTVGVIGRATATSGKTAGVQGDTASTSGMGVFGYATATTGDTVGVAGESLSNTGIGVRGTGVTGVVGDSSRSNGIGVRGLAAADTGNTIGVQGLSNSTAGVGVWGWATASTGLIYGVRGDSYSATGGAAGVYGRALTGSATMGVFGEHTGGGTGVYGLAKSPGGIGVQGVNINGGHGVKGSAGSAGGYGVVGSAFDVAVFAQNQTVTGNVAYLGTRCCAGDFYGNVVVHGTLSKSAGSFKIDHPLDPANRYLYHSFVESPDMKNIYDGVALLDNRGEAIVQLPDWFEALNQDFRYQLTALGAPGPNLHIAEKISHNRFKIAGGAAGSEVSWQVTGTRKDAYAEKHRIPVEEVKPESERGFYLHPDLFGQPNEKSVQWAAHPEAARGVKQNME